MKILSIQSSVAYGHVGNSAAVFPLQRLGHEVWPVYTVHFSNHTGYGAWRGPLIPADDVRAVITGIEERGVLAECDAVLSGYQGGAGIADVIANGTATAGMIAKLASCSTALAGGVSSIRLIDGRGLNGLHGVQDAPGTTLVVN